MDRGGCEYWAGIHGVRGTSGNVRVLGPGFPPRSPPPRAPLAPSLSTLRNHSTRVVQEKEKPLDRPGGGAATHAMPGTAAAEADFPAPTAQADSGKAYLVSPPPPPAPCLAPRVALGRRTRKLQQGGWTLPTQTASGNLHLLL